MFAASYNKPNKSIDECVTYLLNWAKSQCNGGNSIGTTGGEVLSQAVHYYDEDNIEIGKPIQCQVMVSHNIELTDEEKAEARRRAVAQYQQAELQKLQNRNKPTAKKENQVQPSLFEF